MSDEIEAAQALATDLLEAVRVFAFERDCAVMAMHPIDFHAATLGSGARVETTAAPTPRSLVYEYITVFTGRGPVDVIADPDVPRGQLREAAFAAVLDPVTNDG